MKTVPRASPGATAAAALSLIVWLIDELVKGGVLNRAGVKSAISEIAKAAMARPNADQHNRDVARVLLSATGIRTPSGSGT